MALAGLIGCVRGERGAFLCDPVIGTACGNREKAEDEKCSVLGHIVLLGQRGHVSRVLCLMVPSKKICDMRGAFFL